MFVNFNCLFIVQLPYCGLKNISQYTDVNRVDNNWLEKKMYLDYFKPIPVSEGFLSVPVFWKPGEARWKNILLKPSVRLWTGWKKKKYCTCCEGRPDDFPQCRRQKADGDLHLRNTWSNALDFCMLGKKVLSWKSWTFCSNETIVDLRSFIMSQIWTSGISLLKVFSSIFNFFCTV